MIWDLAQAEILRRLQYCIALNTEYQNQFHKTRDSLRQTPDERQFELRSEAILAYLLISHSHL